MASTLRKDYLNISDDESDHDGGYDSGTEPAKGGQKPSATRRAGDDEDPDSESETSEAGVGSGPDADVSNIDDHKPSLAPPEGTGIQDPRPARPDAKATGAKLKLNIDKPLAHKSLVTTDAAIKKSGVVYLSRLPPFVRPSKIRSLLSPYGTINRIFLSPEDPVSHARRVRAGGNKRRTFTEGWVEFVQKRDAKRAVELLNARPIGGRKGNYYRDDIWSLLYLHGFKWRDLTGQIAAEDAERASRMRAELARVAKADKEFVRNVEKARELDGMERKRKKTGLGDGKDEHNAGAGYGASEHAAVAVARRTFAQVPLAKKRKPDADGEKPTEAVSRVLGKIF